MSDWTVTIWPLWRFTVFYDHTRRSFGFGIFRIQPPRYGRELPYL
jgi:hypothetical protein